MDKLPALDKYNLHNYVIKKVSSADEMRSTIIEFEVMEGWMPALDDHQLYYNTDPDGFFIGQLDGKTISCISMVKYGDAFAFLGIYIVLKEHRGNGYGLALFKHAMESVSPTCNVALDGVVEKTPLYRKWGFMETFMNRRIQIDITTAATKLESFVPPSDVFIQPANQVDFNKLTVYDTDVFGAPHHLFLKGLVDGPNTITLVASNQNGGIIGFVAARKTIIVEEGWRLAPLFADNGQIARTLFKAAFKEMIKISPDRKIAMFELSQSTHEASALADELNATPLFDMCRMFTKGQLNFPKEKVFSFCAGELG